MPFFQNEEIETLVYYHKASEQQSQPEFAGLALKVSSADTLVLYS